MYQIDIARVFGRC